MNCQECRDRWAELLYASRGEPLEEKLAHEFQEHLQACATCAAEFRGLQQAQSWLDVLSDPLAKGASPPAVAAMRSPVDLYARLAQLHRRRDAWRYAALGAMAAAVAILAAVWWPRSAPTDPGPSLAIRGASLPAAANAASSSTVDWGPEFQRLAARLEEQDRLLRLLAAELQGAEDRQGTRLLALENQTGRLGQADELQSLRLSAMQHDVDQMREFVTASKGLVQLRAGSD